MCNSLTQSTYLKLSLSVYLSLSQILSHSYSVSLKLSPLLNYPSELISNFCLSFLNSLSFSLSLFLLSNYFLSQSISLQKSPSLSLSQFFHIFCNFPVFLYLKLSHSISINSLHFKISHPVTQILFFSQIPTYFVHFKLSAFLKSCPE